MGDDTPLHLAAAHGHRDIVNVVSDAIDHEQLVSNTALVLPSFL